MSIDEEMVRNLVERIKKIVFSKDKFEELLQGLKELQEDEQISPQKVIKFLYDFERVCLVQNAILKEENEDDQDETEEILSSKTQAKADAALRLPHKYSIKLQGLQKMLRGKADDASRYYDSQTTESEFEAIVKKNPSDTQTWLKYAISLLPKLTHESLEKESNNLHKSLNILSRALRLNRFSFQLWYLYMELYIWRGKPEHVRKIFQQALAFIPNDLDIWWRYLTWESDNKAKKEILGKLMVEALKNDKPDYDRSGLILSVLVQYVLLDLKQSGYDDAEGSMNMILAAKTVSDITTNKSQPFESLQSTFVYQVLSSKHLALLWLLKCHLVYFGRLPDSCFRKTPYEYLVKDELILIRWSVAGRKLSTDQIQNLYSTLKFIAGSFEALVAKNKGDLSSKAYAALARNFFEFEKVVLKKRVEDICKSMEAAVKQHSEISELWLIQSLFLVCVPCGS
jgi:tetratricopeptide (TPR) repeat protein